MSPRWSYSRVYSRSAPLARCFWLCCALCGLSDWCELPWWLLDCPLRGSCLQEVLVCYSGRWAAGRTDSRSVCAVNGSGLQSASLLYAWRCSSGLGGGSGESQLPSDCWSLKWQSPWYALCHPSSVSQAVSLILRICLCSKYSLNCNSQRWSET